MGDFKKGISMKKLLIPIFILFVCSTLFAANEIQKRYTTGKTLFATVVKIDTDGRYIWDGDEFINTTTPPTWTDCDIALAEDGFVKELYTGTFPATVTAGRYLVFYYLGPAATNADVCLGADYYEWSGTGEILLNDVKSKTDNLPASPAAVGSEMALADGAITAAKIATDAIDADALKADAATEIKTALEADGSKLDTLYDDWLDGGRLDLIVDGVKAKTDLITKNPSIFRPE